MWWTDSARTAGSRGHRHHVADTCLTRLASCLLPLAPSVPRAGRPSNRSEKKTRTSRLQEPRIHLAEERRGLHVGMLHPEGSERDKHAENSCSGAKLQKYHVFEVVKNKHQGGSYPLPSARRRREKCPREVVHQRQAGTPKHKIQYLQHNPVSLLRTSS